MSLFSIFKKKNNTNQKIGKELSQEDKDIISNQDDAKEANVQLADNKNTQISEAYEQNDKSIVDSKAQGVQKIADESEDKSIDTKVDREDLKETNIQIESQEEVKLSFFSRLKKTRDNLSLGLSALVHGKKIDDELFEDLETSLLTADLGVETSQRVINKLQESSKLKELKDAHALKGNLKQILIDILKPCEKKLVINKQNGPFVILMVGVNGAGKTTTIGKLAQKFKAQGLSVMLAAGDTFRAAAIEQLKEWANKIGVSIVAQQTGSDSASVLFDALNSAKAKNIDVLICDTAGRLQNKTHLMDELSKVVKVMKKIDANVPHEVLLVLDATTGQNALSQTEIFKEAVDVTAICLTKLDGSAKGGVAFALADKYKLPFYYVGIGERAQDLREFDSEIFVDALLGDNN